MWFFWDRIIEPVIDLKNPKHIVEIGSAEAENTVRILEYCKKKGVKLSSIDPAPQFDVDGFKEKYTHHFDFYKDLSLNALPLITDYDVILIDGDHNWYTVYNELKIIEKTFNGRNFPTVFFHDTCAPYGRRDLYYAPETIPLEFRHPYKKLGIIPGISELCENGGMNQNFFNATEENTPKNGVYTAIEDFISESERSFYTHTYNALYGLTMLADKTDKSLLDYFTTLHSDVMDILEEGFISLDINFSNLRSIQSELYSIIDDYDAKLNTASNLLLELSAKPK